MVQLFLGSKSHNPRVHRASIVSCRILPETRYCGLRKKEEMILYEMFPAGIKSVYTLQSVDKRLEDICTDRILIE